MGAAAAFREPARRAARASSCRDSSCREEPSWGVKVVKRRGGVEGSRGVGSLKGAHVGLGVREGNTTGGAFGG